MRASDRIRSTLVLAILMAGWAHAAGAAPVLHTFQLEDSEGEVVYAGTLVIDDSRLVPDLFTAFDDSSFLSLSITIGDEVFDLSDARNPTTEGVVADAEGDLISFQDDTVQSVSLLINTNGVRLDIVEGNSNWSTTAEVDVSNGPTHIISVPEASLVLQLAAVFATLAGVRAWKRTS